ncbi:hypothetical protein BJ508DRAFT_311764 [Ascobolus immersus RN42]|uniref:Uncharacterized protein n=1 Tax=Ascobolus immersus RN42 TaxID=1160509 RepID=A0A3N4I1B1_ASCIM|nr:hypothetical protein BJ508DRAFT_311764 [Ascobolus immersus RN42]
MPNCTSRNRFGSKSLDVPAPPTPRNIFCTLPFEIHILIGEQLLPIRPFTGTNFLPISTKRLCPFSRLQKTCRLLNKYYSPQSQPALKAYVARLAKELEYDYRGIDPHEPDRKLLYLTRAKAIPARIIAMGLPWLQEFVTAWIRTARNGYRVNDFGCKAGKQTCVRWSSYDEYHFVIRPGDLWTRCHWICHSLEGRHEDPDRRNRLITNWVWLELLTSVIKTFGYGTWPAPEVHKRVLDPWGNRGRARVNRSKDQEAPLYSGKLSEEVRLEMLHFLLSEFMPSLGDGVYESDDDYEGTGFDSDITCEYSGGFRPPFKRDEELYGRYNKNDRRGNEAGPLLSKDEVWFEVVMHLMLSIQHVGCLKLLVSAGGLEWSRWETIKTTYFLGPEAKGNWDKTLREDKLGLIEWCKDQEACNTKFVAYLEGEKRIASLIARTMADRRRDSIIPEKTIKQC